MYLPLYFKADTLSCLIVGGGRVALHKMDKLTSLACELTIISPEIIPEIEAYVERFQIKLIRREYSAGDCQDFDLVVAATSHRDINRSIAAEARQHHIPVNVVDDPELCTVIFSADHNDGDLVISVSTSGQAPFLAASIRNQIATMTEGLGRWVQIAHQFRIVVNREISDTAKRKYYLKLFTTKKPDYSVVQPQLNNSLDVWLDWLIKLEEV